MYVFRSYQALFHCQGVASSLLAVPQLVEMISQMSAPVGGSAFVGICLVDGSTASLCELHCAFDRLVKETSASLLMKET